MTLKPEDRALILATLGVETAEEAVGQDIFTTDEVVALIQAARSAGPVSSGEGAGEDKGFSQGCGSDHSGSRDKPTVDATAALAKIAFLTAADFQMKRLDRFAEEPPEETWAKNGWVRDHWEAVVEAVLASAPLPALPDEVVRLVKAARDVVNGHSNAVFGVPSLAEALEPFADRLHTEEGA